MPLYEYQCKKCHHRFEKIQKFSDKLVRTCPECGGPVEQTISAPAVQFKGSGWYVTDYAKKPSAAAPANGDSATKTDSAKTESKSESGAETESSSKKEDKPKRESKKTEKK